MPFGYAEAGMMLNAAGLGVNISQNQQNVEAQMIQNRTNRKWTEKMYQRQRADNRADWDTQNKYNSPEQQMQRLREAGLNPNLVYGRGADNTAATIQSSQPTNNDQRAPLIAPLDVSGLSNSFSQYQQIKNAEAQEDNTNASTALLLKEAMLKDAQIAATLVGTERSRFDLDLQNEIKDSLVLQYKIQNANAQLQGQNIESQTYRNYSEVNISYNRLELERINTSTNKQKTFQEILESKQRISAMQQQIAVGKAQEANLQEQTRQLEVAIETAKSAQKYQEIKTELFKQGVTENDPAYLRMFVDKAAKSSGNGGTNPKANAYRLFK